MKTSIEVQNHVIFRRFKGGVCIDDMIQSWNEILDRYDDLGSYKGILTSFLEAEILDKDDNLNILVGHLKENLDRTMGLKVAIVMDTPKVTNTIIMSQKMKHMHIRPFSTEEAALAWIEA
jgi:hypothetical protein